jgi:hypothetical protein
MMVELGGGGSLWPVALPVNKQTFFLYTIGETKKTVCVSALCYVIWTLYISE